MNIAGIVTEYNPFHNGHIEHIKKTVELANSSHIIAIMSGSFVQRGEPAITDKWTRAKSAIENGVDLVIELPVVYSCQSAEFFAYGATKLLHSLKIVNSLVFGSEVGLIDDLNNISQVLLDEGVDFKKDLRDSLKTGKSFAKARTIAIEKDLKRRNISSNEVKEVTKGSNNILGIEYLKAIKRLNSPIVPLTYKRLGANYNSLEIKDNIASATGIRNLIKNKEYEDLIPLMPKTSFDNLMDFKSKYGTFNHLNNYNKLLSYLFFAKRKSDLRQIFDMEVGLENRILELSKLHLNTDDLIEAVSSKRYPRTRISRILCHLLLDFKRQDLLDVINGDINYIRILASNKKGFEVINAIKNNSEIEIINKFSDINKNIDLLSRRVLSFEQVATDLYFLGLNLNKPLKGMDFLTSPYISK